MGAKLPRHPSLSIVSTRVSPGLPPRSRAGPEPYSLGTDRHSGCVCRSGPGGRGSVVFLSRARGGAGPSRRGERGARLQRAGRVYGRSAGRSTCGRFSSGPSCVPWLGTSGRAPTSKWPAPGDRGDAPGACSSSPSPSRAPLGLEAARGSAFKSRAGCGWEDRRVGRGRSAGTGQKAPRTDQTAVRSPGVPDRPPSQEQALSITGCGLPPKQTPQNEITK